MQLYITIIIVFPAYSKSSVPMELTWKAVDNPASEVSGGSRIFPGGAPTPKGGVLTYFLGRKLHQNERIWTRGASLAPPLDPPLEVDMSNCFCQCLTVFIDNPYCCLLVNKIGIGQAMNLYLFIYFLHME